jgi:endonuclease/exonuclease/phosphatase family metal-dependent hydrolase
MSTGLPAPSSLTLANINIERSHHLASVMAFLSRTAPDVVCLQELIQEDMVELCGRLDFAHHTYAPMALHPGDGRARPYGVGILSRFPFLATEAVHYAGGGSGNELFDISSADSKVRTSRYVVAIGTVIVGDAFFTVGTTHFPWTPDGSASDHQRRACDRLLEVLGQRPIILCGDFNAPRGREIFSRLATRWRDNVPPHYVTSIDPKLHRAGPLQLMVDGVFSTRDYRVRNVVLHQGVSDHYAITADITAALIGLDLAAAGLEDA